MIELLLESIGAADKENQRKNKPRAGSVPPRATTPSGTAHGSRPPRSADSSTSVRPGSSMVTLGPNKRAKMASSTGSNGHGPSRGQQEHALPHRAPFGSRSGALNASHDTDSVLMTTHKSNKTPGANSSLPRPVSGSKYNHAPPMPQILHSSRSGGFGPGGIGLGYASTLNNRIVSASATMTTGVHPSLSTRNLTQGRSQDPLAEKLHPKKSARNSRRESFRPRQSVDGGPSWAPSDGLTSRYGTAFTSQAVREEDEY